MKFKKELPRHHFLYSKFDMNFIQFMSDNGHFKALKKDIIGFTPISPNFNATPLFEDIINRLEL